MILCTFLLMLLSSLNICGTRNHNKVHHVLRNLQSDIILFQEARWDSHTLNNITKTWQGTVYHSVGANISGGVAIF